MGGHSSTLGVGGGQGSSASLQQALAKPPVLAGKRHKLLTTPRQTLLTSGALWQPGQQKRCGGGGGGAGSQGGTWVRSPALGRTGTPAWGGKGPLDAPIPNSLLLGVLILAPQPVQSSRAGTCPGHLMRGCAIAGWGQSDSPEVMQGRLLQRDEAVIVADPVSGLRAPHSHTAKKGKEGRFQRRSGICWRQLGQFPTREVSRGGSAINQNWVLRVLWQCGDKCGPLRTRSWQLLVAPQLGPNPLLGPPQSQAA